jgi:3'(2'), 5'-bisphosphate nucleotidase
LVTYAIESLVGRRREAFVRRRSLGSRGIAAIAGATLLSLRNALEEGSDPDAIRKEGGRRANEQIRALLHDRLPHDAVLSKEAADGPRRLRTRRVWIVDRLDGMREFGEPGRTAWAGSCALVEDGDSQLGPSLYRQSELRTRPPRLRRGRDRSTGRLVLPSRARDRLPTRPRSPVGLGELVPLGSAGAKAMAVVSGKIDIYFHTVASTR